MDFHLHTIQSQANAIKKGIASDLILLKIDAIVCAVKNKISDKEMISFGVLLEKVLIFPFIIKCSHSVG